ncbi:MAG TPA: hypothetical protein PKD37_00310 [Oligoflexia bacterium]|nr:hypothetical protein [Oligoflexia bacterium]HMP26423.1 hypothetical protein [Oligoflexia bacterium]
MRHLISIFHRGTLQKLPLTSLAFCIFTLSVISCKKDSTSASDNSNLTSSNGKDILEQAYEFATDGSTKLSQLTNEQLSKLFVWEYKVVMPKAQNELGLQKSLSALGQERWECFPFYAPTITDLTLICKRRPQTFLRYVPAFFGAFSLFN